MSRKKDARTWAIEDHLCRDCGGRILRCVTGNGVTPGGNPVYKCADCGKSTASLGPQSLCWCGFSHKHNRSTTAYQCLSFSIIEQYPKMRYAFLACGCHPERGEVGIVLETSMRRAMEQEGGAA